MPFIVFSTLKNIGVKRFYHMENETLSHTQQFHSRQLDMVKRYVLFRVGKLLKEGKK